MYEINDIVYDPERGFGKIEKVDFNLKNYPIKVLFEKEIAVYTIDGKSNIEMKHPVLSLCEYDIYKGGFNNKKSV